MNMDVRIEAAGNSLELPSQPFDHAIYEVNEWRGRCLHAFSRAETAVTECLITLSTIKGRGDQVKLPHLIGQRFEALATVVAAGGSFEKEGRGTATALSAFREFDRYRSPLCHGLGEVTLGKGGQWTLVLRVLTLRSGRASEDTLVFKEAPAKALQKALSARASTLNSEVQKLLKSLPK